MSGPFFGPCFHCTNELWILNKKSVMDKLPFAQFLLIQNSFPLEKYKRSRTVITLYAIKIVPVASLDFDMKISFFQNLDMSIRELIAELNRQVSEQSQSPQPLQTSLARVELQAQTE